MTSRRHRLRDPVSLGLVPGRSSLRPRERAARRIDRLRDPVAFAVAWRETYDEFKAYVALLPADPANVSAKLRPVYLAALYVRRVAYRAVFKGKYPPTVRGWDILRARMERVFAWVGANA